jgi:YHS domain-containing protein
VQADIPCPVNPERPARIEEALLRQVNWEAFYFSDPHARDLFDGDPLRYAAILPDPVSRQRFRPGDRVPSVEHAGRRWYFLSDSTRALFAATPDSFVAVRLPMVPK